MHSVLACVLFLSPVLMIEAHNSCCFPFIVEGKQRIFSEDRAIFYHIDFNNKWLYKSYDDSHQEYNITDFGKKRFYMVTPEGCRYQPFPYDGAYKRCPLPATSIFKLGDSQGGFDAEFHPTWEDDTIRGITVLNKDGVCHPLIANDPVGDFLTLFYDIGPIKKPEPAEVTRVLTPCLPH